tara:strand:+ start:1351 stop:1695 length:345 start_codon:yes stop_codon:yes gene_type:complete
LTKKEITFNKKEKNFNKFYLLFGLLFLLFRLGLDGGVTLTDTKGNKYKFKNESVTCTGQIDSDVSLICEGSAIKKDIAGGKSVVEFDRMCWNAFTRRYTSPNFICSAANKLGKY